MNGLPMVGKKDTLDALGGRDEPKVGLVCHGDWVDSYRCLYSSEVVLISTD